MLQHYEVQYNWQGNKFPLAIQKVGKFEKKNSGAIANILLTARMVYTHLADKSVMEGVASKLAYQ